jgi:hypothetical protein
MALEEIRQVTGGPSKFDLMLALFDRSDGIRKVTFRIQHEAYPPVVVVIHEVGLEDGSGESWLFKGKTVKSKDCPVCRNVIGYFHTIHRTGTIQYST